jgi:TonB-linked SusC/RagA family outer membrane protein
MFKSLLLKGRFLGVLLCCLVSSLVVTAQTKYKGKVIGSDDKLPIIGASVRIQGSTTGAVTDVNGEFTLTLSPGQTLVVSYIGYQSQEVKIGANTSITVTLVAGSNALNEVVVTGYGSQRKKDITGSVAVVNVANLKTVPGGQAAALLQGQAAGVTVVNSGQPGSGSAVRVRGITSIGNTNPLYVIDGVQGNFNDVNANDIESIQVLKDAGSAAIYGVQGSNGVVVITTKKGKAGKATITYDAYYGSQKPLKDGFKLAGSQEYADALQRSVGSVQYPGTGGAILKDYITPTAANQGDPNTAPSTYNINSNQITKTNKVGTDWFHEVFKSAPRTFHNITASGGSEKSSYLMSANYLNEQGTLLNTYLKRYALRVNTNFAIGDHIRIGENAYMFYKSNPTVGNLNEGNAISYTYRQPPVIPVYDIMGNFAGTKSAGLSNSSNPVAIRTRAKSNLGNDWQMAGNVFAEVDFLKHFIARTSFGGTFDNYYYHFFNPTAVENAEGNTNPNTYTEGSGYNSQYLWTNTITYNQRFGKHDIKLLGGIEANKTNNRGLEAGRANYTVSTSPDYVDLDTGAPNTQSNKNINIYYRSLYSQFGKLDYSYNDRYLLSATIRRDGASVFSAAHRFGVFPSVTGGWRISQESFMKDISWLNDLKIRGGWGKLGSISNIGITNATNLFAAGPTNSYYDISGTGGSAQLGIYRSQIGNALTSWEQDVVTNIGFDATLLNNKLEIGFELYKKDIKGLLFRPDLLDAQGGANPAFVNGGNISNKGFDFNFTYHGNVGADFKFDITGNITSYKNKVISLPSGKKYYDEPSAGSTRIGSFTRLQPGQAQGAFFGYVVTGLIKDQAEADALKAAGQSGAEPGFFHYKDVNGDGKISDADRTFFGNPNPDFTYGLTVNANFKNFDFNAFFYGSKGNDNINYVKYWTDFPQVFKGNVSKGILANSWTPSNLGASIPKLSTTANFSNTGVFNSYYMESGSYLRLKTLTLGYSIPNSQVKQLGISRFRIYLQGGNLFTITKYKGLDPEIQPSDLNNNTNFGIDFGNYPANQKTYLLGVQATF